MFRLPKEVIDGIEEYRLALADFLAGKTNPARFKGIRVPWGIYNQRGGRSFMVRIRVASGEIEAGQLDALAAASERYGNAVLHVTTRQDIQIHDVKIEDTIKIIDYLKDHNLSPRGGGGNTVRNITGCPLAGLCEDEVFDTRPYATALTEYMLKDPNSYTLPRKLKIAFSGCGKDCGLATINDIGFIAKEKGGRRGFRVYAGGGMGAKPRVGSLIEDFVTDDEVGYIAEAIKRVFFKYGERKDRHHARLRFLVEKVGLDKFKELYGAELKGLKDSEYIALKNIKEDTPAQKKRDIVEIRLSLGDLPATDAKALSALAKEIPGISFRTSQRQNIYVVNIPQGKAKKVRDELARIGCDLSYASSAKDIVVCAGATTCNLGFCNSRALAKELERVLADVKLNETALKNIRINVNGCPNSCGQHPIATIGLHGLGRKVGMHMAPFYRISVAGIAEEGRTSLGQDAGIVPAKNAPPAVKDFLAKVNGGIKKGTDAHQYMLDKGISIMKDIIKRYAAIPDFEEDKSFYKDWGRDEVFSLEGLSQGECGAGVIDMIESDLAEAGKNLALAKESSFDEAQIREAIHLASRSLLIVKGIEPHSVEEAIDSFKQQFVDKDIASDRFKDVRDIYRNGIKEKAEFFRYAEDLYNEVKRIYGEMDSGFNFPAKAGAGREAVPEVKVLDLRGVACPLNYVKSKLYLETQGTGAVVDIYLDDGEPIANVPKSLESDGQKILDIKREGTHFIVRVQKAK